MDEFLAKLIGCFLAGFFAGFISRKLYQGFQKWRQRHQLLRWLAKMEKRARKHEREIKAKISFYAISLQIAYQISDPNSIRATEEKFIQAIRQLKPSMTDEEALKEYPGWLAATLHT